MEKNRKARTQTTNNKMAEGSSWLTFGSLASRILGAVYIIFWMRWMGDPKTAAGANALFNIGYTYYAYFLDFSTGGVPAAISEKIAYYNSLQEYEVSKRLYKNALKLMAVSGLVFSLLLFILAPSLGAQSAAANPSDASTVIRSLTPAILVLPVMSVTRGFFQGHSNMAPSAISQIIEQFVRVLFMLASVYIVRQVFNGPVLTAVTLSTFAAFVGALASGAYLLWKLRRTDTALTREPAESTGAVSISTQKMLKDIVVTAIPFILISTGISFTQIIDQNTFAPIMERLVNVSPEELQVMSGETIANPIKIITILVSLGAAMGSTAIPIISDLIAKEDYDGIGAQVTNSMQLLFLVILPGALGLFLLAEPVYNIFYGPSELGVTALRAGTIYAIATATVVLLANIMKASGLIKEALITLFLGIVLKLILQYPMMALFGPTGIYHATALAFFFVGGSYLYIIYKEIGFNYRHLFKRLLLIGLLTLAMGLAVLVSRSLLGMFIQPDGFFRSLVIALINAAVGVVVYGFLVLKTGLGEALLGEPAKKLRKYLKI